MKARAEKIQLYYGIFLSALTVAVGVFFIAEAASVYYADPAGMPFTREIAGERLLHVLPLFAVWIAAIAGGFVLSLYFPAAEKKYSADGLSVLRRLKARTPDCGENSFLEAKKRAEKRDLARFLLVLGTGILLLLCAVMSTVRLCRGIDPGKETVAGIMELVKDIAPWLAVAVCSAVAATAADMYLVKSAIRARQKLLVLGRGCPVPPKKTYFFENERVKFWTVNAVRIAVFVLAAVFLGLGIANGGMNGMFEKAVRICKECIGLA